ncbi:MAG: butyrate kinase [Acidobacteriia bacterium]|nr:butyrate kinase [Terriglobia bacterium]
MHTHKILVVNPGSTTTKIALFEDDTELAGDVFRHDAAALRACPSLWDQFELRWLAVGGWTSRNARDVAAVAAMGGLFRGLEGGTYAVNERMLADARANVQGEHASNLGCALAHRLAAGYGCHAYVVDPVSVDEFEPLARYSGHPLISRRSLSHALNIHAAARRAAAETGRELRESSLIVAHLGGGISVAPVRGGRIIDVNDASSDGPFSPERTGGLPLQPFIDLCFSGARSEREMRRLVMGAGGLVAYLGTNSALEVEERIRAGDDVAREAYQAMAYQISKEIGAMSTVLAGRVHAIVLAGGLAGSALLVNWIKERVGFLAPVLVFPGEDEMRALAQGALRAMRGETPLLEY